MELIDYLPKYNFELLKRILKLLNEISKQRELNKMSPYLLTAIFGPLLLRSRSDPLQNELSFDHIHQMCYLLLANYNQIFGTKSLALNRMKPGSSQQRFLMQNNNLKSSFLSTLGESFKEPNKSDILTQFFAEETKFSKFLEIIVDKLAEINFDSNFGNFVQMKLLHNAMFQQFTKIYAENHGICFSDSFFILERETLDSVDIGGYVQQMIPLYTFYRHFAKEFSETYQIYQSNKDSKLKPFSEELFKELSMGSENQKKIDFLQRPFQRIFEVIETLEVTTDPFNHFF
jgi:hypothetical protein